MSNEGVQLRGGAVDYGRPYEHGMAALITIKCALDPEIADFCVLSNIREIGDFDDIVLKTVDKHGAKKMYCVQLKHSEKKQLQASRLEAEKGKFSLHKYLDSYKTIEKNIGKSNRLKDLNLDQIYLVVYTNASLTGTDKIHSISLESTSKLPLLNTSSKSDSVFQVSNAPATSTAPLDNIFLQQFFLCVNQVNATSIEKLIKDEFHSYFHNVDNAVIIAITDYFAKWALGNSGRITKLHKKDVLEKLLEFLLAPYIMEPIGFKKTSCDDSVLNDTLTHFNVTAITDQNLLTNIFYSNTIALETAYGTCFNTDYSWGTNLTDDQKDSIKSNQDPKYRLIKEKLMEKQQFVAHLTLKDLYLCAWQCRIIPLIINSSAFQNPIEEILLKFGDIALNLSFVLFNPSDVSTFKDRLEIFNSVNDIHDEDLLKRNLENMSVSFQGKKAVTLTEYQSKTDILEHVTPDVYITLLNGTLQVGETIEIENYYMKRNLVRPYLHREVLDRTEDMFILVELNGFISYDSVDVFTYLQLIKASESISSTIYIITTNLPHSAEEVSEVADHIYRSFNKNVHILKLSGTTLEWFYSKGTIRDLQQFWINSDDLEQVNYIPEDNMLAHFNSQTNIISSNAGMGKTFMLKSLANKFDSRDWVCYINLSEHVSKIKDEVRFEEFSNHVLEHHITSNVRIAYNFCKQLYENCLLNNRMVWLLDGYDEVASVQTLMLLGDFEERGLILWVTTRTTYKIQLEDMMNTLSLEITNFSKDDHLNFLWKYYESYNHIYHYNRTQIESIISAVTKCSRNLDKTFVTIPLQTRMFAEIFADDINLIYKKERLTIIDLYNAFINIEFKKYKSYEAAGLRKTFSKLALKLFYADDLLDDLLDFEELDTEALTFQESYKKDSIVIGLNEEGDAVFGHRTFAEFMAAQWLAEQIVNKGKIKLKWRPLIEKLYCIELISIREFFDRILCQDLPLHLAVLNNDTEYVDILLEHALIKQMVDRIGRTALHLGVSYGKFYDLYVADSIKGLRNLSAHLSVELLDDKDCIISLSTVEYKQHQVKPDVVDKLIDHGFPNNTDHLFHYDLFDYAMKSCSLGFVNSLYKKYEKSNIYFDESYNWNIFVYHIVRDNLHMILSNRTDYNFDSIPQGPNELTVRNIFKKDNFSLLKTKYNDLYLTEIAAYYGATETLLELLHCGALTIDQGYPAHRACFTGKSKVLNLLCKLGANVEQQDKEGFSKIELIVSRGRGGTFHNPLVSRTYGRTFFKKKCNLMTPLHYASQGGYYDCVKLLLEKGAKVDIEDAYGFTPLMYTSLHGQSNLVELLCSLSEKNEKTQSAMNIAAESGFSDCVKKLIGCGLDVNNVDDKGNTPLILASITGSLEVIDELVASGRCNVNQMKTNESFETVYSWSLMFEHIDFSIKLNDIRAVFEKQSETLGSVSALHFACREGQEETVKALIHYGTNKYADDTIEFLCYSPLIWAAQYGHHKVIKVLLERKSEPENMQKEIDDAKIALIWAVTLGYSECMNILLDYLQSNSVNALTIDDPRVSEHFMYELGHGILPRKEIIPKDINLLLIAIRNNRDNLIEELVFRKFETTPCVNEALWLAARKGHVQCVQKLIEIGCDINLMKTNESFETILDWSSMFNHEEFFKKLFHIGFRKQRETCGAVSALHFACREGQEECVKVLIRYGADKYVDDTIEMLRYSPLIWAGQYGRHKVIEVLLETKPDPENIQKELDDAKIALIWAVALGYSKCMKILLDYLQRNSVNALSIDDSRVLEHLMYELPDDILAREEILPKNINLLLIAVRNNRVHLIEELVLSFEATSSLNDALCLAARNGHLACVRKLIEVGANPMMKNEDFSLYPICWASMYGRTEVVKYFLEDTPKRAFKDKDFQEALNWAAVGGNIDCVKLLLDFGLDVNNICDDLSYSTPLILACEYRHPVEIVEELMAHNCFVTKKSSEGLTALDFAAREKRYDIVKILIASGALKDFVVETDSELFENLQEILKLAVEKEDPELICGLVELGISEEITGS